MHIPSPWPSVEASSLWTWHLAVVLIDQISDQFDGTDSLPSSEYFDCFYLIFGSLCNESNLLVVSSWHMSSLVYPAPSNI